MSVECWDADRFKLFVAHTARHKGKANRISSHLKKYAVSAFVAHDAIEPTRQSGPSPNRASKGLIVA